LKFEIDNWAYILNKCKSIFEKEPVLELAMGSVFLYAYMQRIKPTPLNFIKKWAAPFYWICKKNFSGGKKIDNTLDDGDVKKSYGVFGIGMSRDNDFGCIFPVLKRMDELGEHTILFTNREVYSVKKEEIEALKHNSLFFYDDLHYNLSSVEILKSFIHAQKLVDKLIRETKDEKIIDFARKYKSSLISSLESLMISSKSISKILVNKDCKFLFSLGTPVFGAIGIRTGIRTVMIQHGYHGDEGMRTGIHYSPHNSDEIIVWGERPKNQVLPVCGSNHKIFAFGNPRYDMIIELLNNKRGKGFYNKLNIDQRKKNVVFFSETFGIDEGLPPEKFIEPIFALEKLYKSLKPKINLIIQLHPNETIKYYEKYMSELLTKVKIIKSEIPHFELLQHTDIMMSLSSTTLLESMIFGSPTLQLTLTEHKVSSEYYEYGATILITDTDELIDMVEKIISGVYDLTELKTNQKRFVEMNLANLGNATDIIVDHLLYGP
jgi:hypothetical protein